MSEVKDAITGNVTHEVNENFVYSVITGRPMFYIENGILKSAITGASIAIVGSGGGGGGGKFYKCTFVDAINKTWSGYAATIDSDGYVTFADEVTDGLSYSLFTPKIGEIWSENAMLQIGTFSTPITYPTDFAFNIPMDTVNHSQFIPPPNEYSVWAPNPDYYQAAEFYGVKCLQIRYSSSAVVGQGSLWFAGNSENDSTAVYGPGQPWTFSFWFYPYSDTGEKVGDNGRMFDLGEYNMSQLTLYYNDNDGSFKIGTTDGSYIATAEWGGYAPYGEWSHVCITAGADAKTYKLYINGQFAATTTMSSALPNSFDNAHMGFPAFHGNGRTACGGFAKLKWYNRVLEPGEIMGLAQEISKTADNLPKAGLAFYASLDTAASFAETGQGLTTVGDVPYSTVGGITCANFENRATGYINAESTNVPYGDSARSISLWFYINEGAAPDSGTMLFGYGSKNNYGGGTWYNFDANPSGKCLFLGFYSYDESIPADIEYNRWYHVCLTKEYNSPDTLCYLNGLYIGTFANNYSNAPNVNDILRFGTVCFDDGKRTSGLNGNLSGFRIYNRVLTQGEITALANEFTPTA